MPNDMTWSTWLRQQLDERQWPQAELVRRSGGAIKADRVSKWLKGTENPSHRNVIRTANALDADIDEALEVAGYGESLVEAAFLEQQQALAEQRQREQEDSRLRERVLRETPTIELLEELVRREQLRGGDGRVIEGRFQRLGSGREFPDTAVAHVTKRSIFDEQEQRGE